MSEGDSGTRLNGAEHDIGNDSFEEYFIVSFHTARSPYWIRFADGLRRGVALYSSILEASCHQCLLPRRLSGPARPG